EYSVPNPECLTLRTACTRTRRGEPARVCGSRMPDTPNCVLATLELRVSHPERPRRTPVTHAEDPGQLSDVQRDTGDRRPVRRPGSRVRELLPGVRRQGGKDEVESRPG